MQNFGAKASLKYMYGKNKKISRRICISFKSHQLHNYYNTIITIQFYCISLIYCIIFYCILLIRFSVLVLLKILNFLNYIILLEKLEKQCDCDIQVKISMQTYFLFTLKENIFWHLARSNFDDFICRCDTENFLIQIKYILSFNSNLFFLFFYWTNIFIYKHDKMER